MEKEDKERDENYFILLELPFDPPESDKGKIQAAIAAKQQQWSKDQNHPAKKAKASQYLSWLDDINDTMLESDSKRKAEAKAAKDIRDKKTVDLDKKLKVYSYKETELSEKDLNNLLKSFQKYGFDSAFIKKRFQGMAKGREETGPDVNDVISKDQAKNITKNFESLNSSDNSLYTFLGLSSSSSCEQLCEAANAMRKKILAKGDKTGEDTAKQALCGVCLAFFRDNNTKRKYDNYCSLTRYTDLNSMIDDLAEISERRIEPKEKEDLIGEALNLHPDISVSEASIYIDNYCAYMGYALPENKIICASCNAENPAGATTCCQCGKQLIVTCPSCGAQNDNATKTCIKCGFDLSKMDTAQQLIEKAKAEIAEKHYREASDLIKEAKLYWPNHPDIAVVEKTIQDFQDQYDATVREIHDDLADRKYYAARTRIQKAESEGFSIDPSLSDQAASAISTAESRIAEIRQMGSEDAFLALQDLAGTISDSPEVQKLADSYPPEPATNPKAVRQGQNVMISWDASTSAGDVEYLLVRKENAYANSPEDGEVVYEGTEHTFTDTHLEQAVVYYYIVLARRLGVLSGVTRIEQPQVVVGPVTDLKAIGGNGMITLSWNKADTISEVRISIYQGDSQPASEQDYREVPSNRLDGAILNDLENGKRYWIRVTAWHTIGGNAYPADPVIIQAVPEKPAKPLENFQVTREAGKFRATWDQSEWDVILYSSKQKPEYSVGTIYDAQELAGQYERIDLMFQSTTEAEFTIDFIGECYIIPGVINANNVILNQAVYVSNVPPARDVTFDLNSAGTELYVNFTWPQQIDRSVLVYRMDQYPDGPEDQLATRVECSRKQYDSNEGILISSPEKGTLYGAVYMFFDGEGHRIYSEGVRILINNEPQRDVFYSFDYRKIKHSRDMALNVTVRSNGTFIFPPFVVVGKFKGLPLKRSDGDIIASVMEQTEISGSREFPFEISKLRDGYRLKMFFVDDENYKRYKIQNEGSSSI